MTFELDEDDLAAYFARDIRPDLDATAQRRRSTSGDAKVVFVGAQPAAGKTRVNALAMREDPRLVPVIGDDLRIYHPDYDDLMERDPLAMPDATAQASGRWIGMSAAHLRSLNACALVETTLRQAPVLLRELEAFKQANYTTELRVLAVPPEVSRASTLMRYAADASQHDAGRWTPSTAHDAAVAAGPATMAAAITSGLLDHITIQTRQGRVLYAAPITPATRQTVAADAAAALTTGRDPHTLPAPDARAWLDSTRTAITQALDHGPLDADIRSTIRRIIDQDAPTMTALAYPDQPDEAAHALQALHDQGAILTLRQIQQLRGPATARPDPSPSPAHRPLPPHIDRDRGHER